MLRCHGGLGVRTARENNIFMLGKFSWGIIQGTSKPWVEILSEKCLKDGNLLQHKPPPAASPIRKAIFKALSFLKDGYKWQIGNGDKVSIFFVNWVFDFPLKDIIFDIDPRDLSLRVADIIGPAGGWDLSVVHSRLAMTCSPPKTACRFLSNLPFPQDNGGH